MNQQIKRAEPTSSGQTSSWSESADSASEEGKLDWRKKMSDNVAYALIVYTAINIFATVQAVKATGLKPYAMAVLVLLVALIIPVCRSFEKSWREISDEDASDPKLAGRFRRDQFFLWLLAIGLPLFFTGILMLIGENF